MKGLALIGLLALAACQTPPALYTPTVSAAPNGGTLFAADLSACKSYERATRVEVALFMVGKPFDGPDDIINECLEGKGYTIARPHF